MTDERTMERKWRIGIAISIFTIILGFVSFDPVSAWRDRGVKRAEQLQACMKFHHMSKATERTDVDFSASRQAEGEYGQISFASCRWPPKQSDSADGYSAIDVIVADGPGFGEDSGTSMLNRVTATCDRLKLWFTTGSQDATTKLAPYAAEIGSVVIAATGQPYTGKSPYPYPRQDELVVVKDTKIVLDKARCL